MYEFILFCFDIKPTSQICMIEKIVIPNAFQILKLVLIDKAKPLTKSKPDDNISLYCVISQSVTDLTGHSYNPVRNI